MPHSDSPQVCLLDTELLLFFKFTLPISGFLITFKVADRKADLGHFAICFFFPFDLGFSKRSLHSFSCLI